MSRPGSWLAGGTAFVAMLALGVGISTPPRSGPNCVSACIGPPYTGGAGFVPRDYWWMYPASLLALLAIALFATLPHRSTPAAVLSARVAVPLAAIAAGALVADYALQLTVMQPSLLKGEAAGLGLLSQYNPHGVFIALENVGYLLLGVASGCAGLAMTVHSRLERVARAVLVTGGAVTVLALVGFALAYRSDLEYRFEVAGIAIDWLTLIVAGVLLCTAWRRSVVDGGGNLS